MGIIMMLFGLWCWRTRPTERRIFRYLAVSLSAATRISAYGVAADQCGSCADEQYWLFFTCCVGSGWFVAHVMDTMVRGFGQWVYIGSVKCES